MDDFDALQQLFEGEDSDLFKPKPKKHVVSADDRLVESFSQITDFVNRNGRKPDPEADDIKEASLGHRLDSLRADREKADKLEEYDELGLLRLDTAPESLDDLFADSSDLFSQDNGIFDTSKLPEQKRVVENEADPARRKPAKDFESKYKLLFEEQQRLLAENKRKFVAFNNVDQIVVGGFYVYEGMMCYVAGFGKKERKAGGYSQQRLLVIFENGTESNMYRRSLAQRLYEGGMIVTNAESSDSNGVEETQVDTAGRIYVLQSLNTDPKITTIKNLYKIGFTLSSVADRVKNAEDDPTYLMAPVKVVEEYRLTGDYVPEKVESMIHDIFAKAKVDMTIVDKNGYDYVPSEWYSVPLPQIRFAIDAINSGDIRGYHYDSGKQEIVENE